MELALNLVCLLLVCATVLAWTVWRRNSVSRVVPQLGFGFVVIACVLTLVVPAISITDDLAQAPLPTESVKSQDVLKAAKHTFQFCAAAIPMGAHSCLPLFVLWRKDAGSPRVHYQLFCWNPTETRAPPFYSL